MAVVLDMLPQFEPFVDAHLLDALERLGILRALTRCWQRVQTTWCQIFEFPYIDGPLETQPEEDQPNMIDRYLVALGLINVGKSKVDGRLAIIYHIRHHSGAGGGGKAFNLRFGGGLSRLLALGLRSLARLGNDSRFRRRCEAELECLGLAQGEKKGVQHLAILESNQTM